MRIECCWSSAPEHNPMDPFPPEGKNFLLSFFSGDFAWPYGGGNWFEKPYFTKCIRFFTNVPLPHFAWRFGSLRGYLSLAKPYGMEQIDSDEAILAAGRVPALEPFRSWLKPEEVYHGSQAIMASARNGLSALFLIVPGLLAWAIWSNL